MRDVGSYVNLLQPSGSRGPVHVVLSEAACSCRQPLPRLGADPPGARQSCATMRPDFITHVRGGWAAIASGGTPLAVTAQRSAGAPTRAHPA